MGRAVTNPLLVRGAILAAAVLLAGCAAPGPPAAESATQLPAAAPSAAELPVLSYFAVVMAPHIDGYAARTGQIARPRTEKIAVFDAAGGKPLALLPAAESVPVVGRAEGWVRVMLPSRRILPSARPSGIAVIPGRDAGYAVNGATGWVKESDVDVVKDMARIEINRGTHLMRLISHTGLAFESYPVTVGADVPNGPTYVSSGSGVAGGCVDTPPVQLTAQSETADGLRGQSVSPVFIAGPRAECDYSTGDLADAARDAIRISAADAKSLAAFLLPGMEIDIISGVPAGQVAS